MPSVNGGLWQSTAPGARFKAVEAGGRRLRLLELTPEFVEPDWCRRGHMGMVLEGELEIAFKSRGVSTFRAGDGLMIPAGEEAAHKARAISLRLKLMLVEDV